MPPGGRRPRLRHDECRRVAFFLTAIRKLTVANPAIAAAVIRAMIAAANKIPRTKRRDGKGRFTT